MTARYTTENGSYYGQLLHLKRATGESRFPLYYAVGDVERLVDGSATVTDSCALDSFGRLIVTGQEPDGLSLQKLYRLPPEWEEERRAAEAVSRWDVGVASGVRAEHCPIAVLTKGGGETPEERVGGLRGSRGHRP